MLFNFKKVLPEVEEKLRKTIFETINEIYTEIT
jgi:hypothetical protein